MATDKRLQDHCRCGRTSIPVSKSISASEHRSKVDEQSKRHFVRAETKFKSHCRASADRCYTPKCRLGYTKSSSKRPAVIVVFGLTDISQERIATTDAWIESTLRATDVANGKWLNEDPSLAQIQQILVSRQ